MKLWTKVVGGVTTTLMLGAAPVIQLPERQWVAYSMTNEAGIEICFDEYRRTNDTIKKEIPCEEYYRRASTKDYPNPVKLGVPELGKGETTSVLGFIILSVTPKTEAAVAFSAESNSGLTGGVNTVSFNHTAPTSGTLFVGSLIQDASGIVDRTVTTCTYNSISMFLADVTNFNSVGGFTITVYELHNPSSGTNTVFCEFNDKTAAFTPNEVVVEAISFTGADQNIPLSVVASSTGTSAEASVTITTLIDSSMLIDFMLTDETGPSDILPGGSLHTQRSEIDFSGENALTGTAGLVSPAGATTTSWTWTGSEEWVQSVFAIRPPCVVSTTIRCTEVITTTGTSTWTAPTSVSSVDVACWGAGGGGGTIANNGGGGGGGGAYASTTGITVTAGNNYSFFIGSGGAAETAGTASYFFNDTNYSPYACGGNAASNSTAGTGGTTACSVGSAAEFAGGNGADGDTTTTNDGGGGGGGGGGPHGAGVNGSISDGAIGGNAGNGDVGYGGPGGTGGSSNAGAIGSGSRLGGGGGGGGDNTNNGGEGGRTGGGGGGSEVGGGTGGNGLCEISYVQSAAEAGITTSDYFIHRLGQFLINTGSFIIR